MIMQKEEAALLLHFWRLPIDTKTTNLALDLY